MQTQRRVWKYFQQCNVVSFVVGKCLLAALALPVIGIAQQADLARMHTAQAAPTSRICSRIDSIRQRTGSRRAAAGASSSTRCRRPGVIKRFVARVSLKARAPRQGWKSIVRRVRGAVQPMGASFNAFPYGSCTWWANQRYYELHGIFVPWVVDANAGRWAQHAQAMGWRVSARPQAGSIAVMQPGVQGAYGYGHVAVVERVLKDGSVIASSMNWGARPWAVTMHRLHPGPGIAFVRQL